MVLEIASAAAGFEHELPATPRGLPDVRRTFRDWTTGVVADDAIRADLVLAISELCSTAMGIVARARGRSPVPLTVRAWVDGAAIVIEIGDPYGEAVDRRVSATEADETSRALSIVATLADVLTVRAFDHEILLRARKERAVGDLGRSVAGAR